MTTQSVRELLGVSSYELLDMIHFLGMKPKRIPNKRFRYDLSEEEVKCLKAAFTIRKWSEVNLRQELEKIKERVKELGVA